MQKYKSSSLIYSNCNKSCASGMKSNIYLYLQIHKIGYLYLYLYVRILKVAYLYLYLSLVFVTLALNMVKYMELANLDILFSHGQSMIIRSDWNS